MKKILALLLCICLSFLFFGCGGINTTNDKVPTDISSDQQESTQSPSNEVEKANEESSTEPVITDTNSKQANITETQIFNSNDIIVTAKTMSYDGWMGPELSVLIENNSSQNITVQTRNASINGLMVDPTFSADVAAGKKANETISVMSSELEQAGITVIKDIEFVLHIFDTDSWDEIVDSEVIALTTDATDYTQTFDDTGIVAFDEDGIKIIAKKLNSSDSFWGADLYLYIENNTDKDVTVQARDVSIDGFMVDPVFSSEIVHGKKAFDSLTFMESDLTENGITEIKQIELCFHIFDTASWDTIKDSDIITIAF